MKRLLGIVAVSACLLSGVARAQVLNFEGIPVDPSLGITAGEVGNWYDGGGPNNYGIDFSSNALWICLNTSPPSGNCVGSNASRGGQGDPTSRGAAMFFLTGGSTYMNKASGFTTGFSFYYSAINDVGSFNVYDGLNGTGLILASLPLGITTNTCDFNVYAAQFCPFYAAGVSFAGIAQSVGFAGVGNQITFDDVTFGSPIPGNVVPEPASLVLLATGLFGIGAIGIARRFNIG